MEVYHQMRKLKSTTQMEERVGSLNASSLRGWDADRQSAAGADASVAAVAATAPPVPPSTAAPLLPLNFSPPPIEWTDSTTSNSRHNSVVTGGDVMMQGAEDIDWVSQRTTSTLPFCQNPTY